MAKPTKKQLKAKAARRRSRQVKSAASAKVRKIQGEGGGIKIEAAAGDGVKVPTFATTLYSGGVLKVDGFPHGVVAEVAGIEWDGNPVVARLEHQPGARVGHADHVDIITSGQHRVDVAGKISAMGSPAAKEVIENNESGYPWKSSITLNPLVAPRFIPAGETVRANGRVFTGPVEYVEKSELHEMSFVDIAGDSEQQTVTIAAMAAVEQRMESDMTFSEYVADLGLVEADLTDAQRDALTARHLLAYPEVEADGETETETESTTTETVEATAATTARTIAASGKGNVAPNVRQAFLREQAEAEREAHAITTICAKYDNPNVMNPETKKEEPLSIVAKFNGWDADKTELEAIRASRSAVPAFHAGSGETRDANVIEASLCIASGMKEDAVGCHYNEQTMNAAVARENRNFSLRRVMFAQIQAAGMHHPMGDYGDEFLAKAYKAERQIEAAGVGTMTLSGSLGNVANKIMAEAFRSGDNSMMRIAKQVPVNNLLEHSVYRMSTDANLVDVPKSGIVESASIGEASHKVQAKEKARNLHVPRAFLINDELGQFATLSQQFANKALVSFNRLGAMTLLLGKVQPASPHAFFHANNGNYFDGLLSEASLTEAEKLLMLHKDEAGDPVNNGGSLLLTSPKFKATGNKLYKSEKLVGQGKDASPEGEANVHHEKFEVVSAPMLDPTFGVANSDADNWWLLADPDLAPVLSVAFLNGNTAPTVQQGEPSLNYTGGIILQSLWDFGFALAWTQGAVMSVGKS